MSRKKLIIIICVIAAVIVSAISVVFFVSNRDKEVNLTPIPTLIDISASADVPKNLSDSNIDKNQLTPSEEMKETTLCSVLYNLRSYTSDATYITDSGVTAHTQKINEYLDIKTGELCYTITLDKESSATFDKNGTLIRSSGSYSPTTDYFTENVIWFYKDGNLSCGEMSFSDNSGNFGTAYYNADGALLCIVTEIYSVDSDNEPVVEYSYYDNCFNTITEDEFLSLIPETDSEDFLYINWQ